VSRTGAQLLTGFSTFLGDAWSSTTTTAKTMLLAPIKKKKSRVVAKKAATATSAEAPGLVARQLMFDATTWEDEQTQMF